MKNEQGDLAVSIGAGAASTDKAEEEEAEEKKAILGSPWPLLHGHCSSQSSTLQPQQGGREGRRRWGVEGMFTLSGEKTVYASLYFTLFSFFFFTVLVFFSCVSSPKTRKRIGDNFFPLIDSMS